MAIKRACKVSWETLCAKQTLHTQRLGVGRARAVPRGWPMVRSGSRRRRSPRGGNPICQSQLSRRGRGLPVEDRGRSEQRDVRVMKEVIVIHAIEAEVIEAKSGRCSPRQPRYPPPGFVETWHTCRVPTAAAERRSRTQTPSGRWQPLPLRVSRKSSNTSQLSWK